MAEPDFYKVLGVAKGASADDIRKAYRKLARENHPDVKKDDSQAAERFKQIQEAYAILGDAKKREQYDRFGTAAFQGGPAGGPGGRGYTWSTGQSPPFDINELFGGGGGFDFEELLGGRRTGKRGGPRPAPRGSDLEAAVRVPFETAALGGSVDVHIEHDGRTEELSVKIPAGIADGGVIRLAGQGAPSPRGGAAGDLLLTVNIEPHKYFRREGSDLLVEVPVTPSEAMLGAKVDVPTLAEGHMVVTIPPGTSSGMKLRLRGKGAMNPQTKQPGDQYVVVKIVVPREASATLKDLYRQVAEHESSPRTGLWP